MNKEFLVVLLEKDIRELQLLTEGFADLEVFPKSILRLAKQKAENIIQNLNELESSSAKPDTKKTEKEEAAVVPVEDETFSSDITFLADKQVADNTAVSETENTSEEKIIIPEISEAEETIKEEPVDFVEDITEYAVQHKSVVEPMEEEEEGVKQEETAMATETVAEEEKTEEIQTIQEKKPEESIVIKSSAEEPESSFNSVNESIKIDDIRTAINIADRFRFQRELFGGNGELMNRIIGYLNQLQKYEEAVSFLNNKFGWTKENQHAEDFMQIVRRRYL